jgi:hypothetical protein
VARHFRGQSAALPGQTAGHHGRDAVLGFPPGHARAVAARRQSAGQVLVSADWLRLAHLARALSWSLVLTAGTAVFEPALGIAKRRIGARLGSPATAGEGAQNLLCAYLAIAVFAGLAAGTLWGAWWLDGVVALGIAGWAVVEGRRAWAGRSCGCACPPGTHC